jgi:hypothetical protein
VIGRSATAAANGLLSKSIACVRFIEAWHGASRAMLSVRGTCHISLCGVIVESHPPTRKGERRGLHPRLRQQEGSSRAETRRGGKLPALPSHPSGYGEGNYDEDAVLEGRTGTRVRSPRRCGALLICHCRGCVWCGDVSTVTRRQYYQGSVSSYDVGNRGWGTH